jgi:hypothetical protein
MRYTVCEVCGIGAALRPLEPFNFNICLCDGCVESNNRRGEDIVAAITEVLRS